MLVLGCLRPPNRWTTEPIVDKVAFRTNPTPMWLYDADTLAILDANDAALDLYGYSRADVRSMTMRHLEAQEPAGSRERPDGAQGLLNTGVAIHRRADGSPISVDITSLSVSFGGRSCRLVLATDLTGRHDYERALAYLAQREEVVQLPHRAQMIAALDDAVGKSRRQNTHVAVLFLDLANVSYAGNARGSLTGAAVLADVAERLSATVRAQDYVGRLRDDELVVILGNLDSEDQLAACIARLMESVSEPFPIGDLLYQVRACVGVSVAPFDGSSAEALLRSADEAMRHAAATGIPVYYSSSGGEDGF